MRVVWCLVIVSAERRATEEARDPLVSRLPGQGRLT